MPYIKTVWKDRIVEYARRFTKTGETANSVTLTADPGAITEAGTPVNAANMNKIEQGIETVTALAEAAKPYTDNKFGAVSTAGVLDWNDATNTRPGSGYTLLSGSAANGPGPALYYTPFNFEFASKNGTGSITQLALPYNQVLLPADGMYMRTRYSGVWTPWTKYWNTNMLRVDSGQLEFYDGTEWRPVGVPYPGWLADLDAFNDGTDGAFSPSANTTLPAGIHRFSSINIPVGVTITSSGSFLVILVKDVANIAGTISVSGKGSAGSNTNTAGVAGKVAAGAGGGGGYNVSGLGTTGGNGGTAAIPGGGAVTNSNGQPGASTSAFLIESLDAIRNYGTFAGGGGGAGGSGAGVRPAGGAGGGAVIVVARQITGAGAIRADGLNGANGDTTGSGSGGAGGGGGGGGGLAVAVARSISNLTMSAAGGLGGARGSGTSYDGGKGGDGFSIKIIK